MIRSGLILVIKELAGKGKSAYWSAIIKVESKDARKGDKMREKKEDPTWANATQTRNAVKH